MRQVHKLTPGVIVATSDKYVTNSVIVTGRSGGCLVIDPAITVVDLDALVADLGRLGLTPEAGFATHPHWDHVLWHQALGDVPRYASQRAAAMAERERAGLIEGAEESAPGHDLALIARLRPLDPGAERLPWDGADALVVTHEGHAPGHSAIFLPDSGTLIAGDMCSDIEIPLPDLAQEDPVGDYRAGLERLAQLPVRQVVPGHGAIGDAAAFRDRVAMDMAYLDELDRGGEPADARLTVDWLRAERADQVERLRELRSGRK
jgi:hydroxyacylglutathione hydrolase